MIPSQKRITEKAFLLFEPCEASSSTQLRSHHCASAAHSWDFEASTLKYLFPRQEPVLEFAHTGAMDKISKNTCSLSRLKKYCLFVFKSTCLVSVANKTISPSKLLKSYVSSLTFPCTEPDFERAVKAFYNHHCGGRTQIQLNSILVCIL